MVKILASVRGGSDGDECMAVNCPRANVLVVQRVGGWARVGLQLRRLRARIRPSYCSYSTPHGTRQTQRQGRTQETRAGDWPLAIHDVGHEDSIPLLQAFIIEITNSP